MKVCWEAEDGYVGGSRPQSFIIDDSDLEGLSSEEIDEYVNDSIQDDFEQKISWIRLDNGD